MSAIQQLQASIKPAAGGGNGLLTGLVPFWKLDEASGNGVDSNSSITLTDNNTVTSNTGQVYALAREFTAPSSESLSATDPAGISFSGNQDFTIAVWWYMASNTVFNAVLCKASSGSPANREYSMFHENTYGMIFGISNGTTMSEAASGSNLSAGAWHFAIGWHDSTLDTANVQVDGGSVVSVAHSAGVQDASKDFYIGSIGAGDYFSGRVGPACIWNRILTSDQRTALWNSGAGLAYADFTS